MISPAIQATVEAIRQWSWASREAWGWLTECQQMRDLLDPLMQSREPEEGVQLLHTSPFAQQEWFLEQIPSDPQIGWRAMCHLWHKGRAYSGEIEPWKTVKTTLAEGRLRDPFEFHAREFLGWQPVQAGQAEHLGLCYAPLEGMVAWLRAHHISPIFEMPTAVPGTLVTQRSVQEVLVSSSLDHEKGGFSCL